MTKKTTITIEALGRKTVIEVRDGKIKVDKTKTKKSSKGDTATNKSSNIEEPVAMSRVTAKYLNRRNYEIVVQNGEKEIKRMFVMPFFNWKKAARSIIAITESLNVEEDVDVSESEIYYALKQAAKRANKNYALKVSY